MIMMLRTRVPFGEIEESAFGLFTELADRYEWYGDEARAQMRKLLSALIEYFAYDTAVANEMVALYGEALEDARTGRGHAEVENFVRDVNLAGQQASEQEGVR